MMDCNGIERQTGEEWLNRTTGAYLPLAYEEVVSIVKAYVLADKVCVIMSYSLFLMRFI